jgi:hypothetical protein
MGLGDLRAFAAAARGIVGLPARPAHGGTRQKADVVSVTDMAPLPMCKMGNQLLLTDQSTCMLAIVRSGCTACAPFAPAAM